ncbi:hypothetical protein HYPBUDRAFT_214180 [Hyphopichia burtonii NRRL Y-1933]|uniref:Uncharacterized protein n=1 Tax=Hyphopichia burtonii NRRL Y-1933 TaxID=984485 RepID=A0A1E4RGQ0_9ASCO|nr:hypothetical protein HYPBUDRAFT_214180 [Hyphopichia burtonii NRRL Y-1933]ODV66430.1 hypothetical protein HYPBUDRAFT_214180 [Hyphopichia burtonii NRRL Y-1933]
MSNSNIVLFQRTMVSLWVVRPPSTSSKYTYLSKWKITHNKTIVITAQRNKQPINKNKAKRLFLVFDV